MGLDFQPPITCTPGYLAAGESIVQELFADATVENWLDGVWDRVQLGFDKDGESQSSETVDGKQTVVFQWQRFVDEEHPEHGYVLKKVQMAVDDPLLAKEQTYQVDESGASTLLLDFSVTEYRLLPAGSTMPPAP